ncbi:MAG: nucleotidyltransferase domain-containing protein [Nanoarchaeota archaeon]|nr:nucleotidyltransferase domain-containing protein [Nanoarchaeota archaeon]MBU1501475.1 nucleotidyltransferase domain-containing protein [Nanoarchaeota archaeon]
MNKEFDKLKTKIVKILKKYEIVRAGIFGSYARGEPNKNSDIDILIQIRNGKKFSLFDLSGLKINLEEKLGKKVDINTYRALHPKLKSRILNEEMRII